MKAILLAAGLGSRLRPLTDTIPKCLAPINGEPLMGIWFELLERHGVDEVLINTHYLAEKVAEFVDSRKSPMRVRLSHEDTLAGSAGTIERNWDFVSSEDEFLVCNADNLTDVDLSSLVEFHRGAGSMLTMAVFESDRPSECGIVEIDAAGRMLSFEEKPARPRSNLANGGVYVMDRRIGDRLPAHKPADIAFDLIPSCIGEAYGWNWPGLLLDIGNPEAYRAAQRAMAAEGAAHADR